MNIENLELFIEACESAMVVDYSCYQEILNVLNQVQFTEPAVEASDSNVKIPIYLVLMHSGTWLANAIQKVTKDEYSHICISFNDKLDPMYSFGRKKADSGVGGGGFVANNPTSKFFTEFKTKYGVYVMFITKAELNAMKVRLEFFIKNEEKLKYSFSGLLFNYVKIPNENQRKFFCSRFVADVINAGKKLEKKSSMYRPNEFSQLSDVTKVNEGDDFYKYNYKITRKNVQSLVKEDK